jgi:hypothetical protein
MGRFAQGSPEDDHPVSQDLFEKYKNFGGIASAQSVTRFPQRADWRSQQHIDKSIRQNFGRLRLADSY